MKELIKSVGIDIGTSTTQIIFSHIYIENLASDWAVPDMAICDREIIYESKIYLTPLISNNEIDVNELKRIVDAEYRNANVEKSDIKTGAVIITGDTARKDNSREVLNILSEYAGDFIVKTAGPDLESILAGRGAGTEELSKEKNIRIANIDIGGGTSNIALYDNGNLISTACLDIGGRLIKYEKGNELSNKTDSDKIYIQGVATTYLYKGLKKYLSESDPEFELGDLYDDKKITNICRKLAIELLDSITEKGASDSLYTNGGNKLLGGSHTQERKQIHNQNNDQNPTALSEEIAPAENVNKNPTALSEEIAPAENVNKNPITFADEIVPTENCVKNVTFSGGVASFIYELLRGNIHENRFPYNDIGYVLAEEIISVFENNGIRIIEPRETIRATVLGAGMHVVEISGSTIYYKNVNLPVKNIPIIKLQKITKESVNQMNILLRANIESGEKSAIAVSFPGLSDISFEGIKQTAELLISGLYKAIKHRAIIVIITEQDIAKALGFIISGEIGCDYPLISIDSVSVKNGDYVDIGSPCADGMILPVVVKTLVFNV